MAHNIGGYLDKTQKLDGSKYHTWSIKMNMALVDRDC